MVSVASPNHVDAANKLKQLVARYEQSRDLINVGAYTRGADPVTDMAVDKQPMIRDFLAQSLDQAVTFEQSVQHLLGLIDDTNVEAAADAITGTGNGSATPAQTTAATVVETAAAGADQLGTIHELSAEAAR